MGWADRHIAELKAGNVVRFRPRGNSMSGKIESGQLVTVWPIGELTGFTEGDIVLCTVSGNQYLHLIKACDPVKRRVLICNNRGRENGWTSFDRVYGRVVGVE